MGGAIELNLLLMRHNLHATSWLGYMYMSLVGFHRPACIKLMSVLAKEYHSGQRLFAKRNRSSRMNWTYR